MIRVSSAISSTTSSATSSARSSNRSTTTSSRSFSASAKAAAIVSSHFSCSAFLMAAISDPSDLPNARNPPHLSFFTAQGNASGSSPREMAASWRSARAMSSSIPLSVFSDASDFHFLR